MPKLLNTLDSIFYESYKEILLNNAVTEKMQESLNEVILELRQELQEIECDFISKDAIKDLSIKLKARYRVKAQQAISRITTNMSINDGLDAAIRAINKIVDEWKEEKIKEFENC